LLYSCADDILDRTIFIPDENNPNLPTYTEWGYNSFGAIYERDYFLASNSIVPCKIMYVNGQLHFALQGTIRNNKMTLLFIFPHETISVYTQLLTLHDVEIDLNDDACIVKIIEDDVEKTLTVLNGKLHFKRAQLLTIDDVVSRVILSGVFELQFLENIFPASISDGRFDVGINDRDFYNQ